MNSYLPASFVGGRVWPCRLFADPLSSPIASIGMASKTGSEAIPMASLKQRERFTLDDGPRSKIREGGLKAIWKNMGSIPRLDSRGAIFLSLCPLEDLSLPAPFPFGSRSVDSRFFFQIGGEEDVNDSSVLSWGALFVEKGGNIARLPASVLYDEYQQAGTRRRLPFNAPPPRLTKMAPLGMGAGPFPLGNIIGDAPLAASSRWELMKEWLERRTEHWDPSEDLADASLRVGPESAAESRVSAGLPF
ncbi:BnaC05g32110D [Brassica napus]|uniref:BnaC05g32110D protein n=1 Tax=Brassica napus TaxID=3708 RepID=A0A078GWC0_BRANA|nr:BnaC05g32110D [Brassica napus]